MFNKTKLAAFISASVMVLPVVASADDSAWELEEIVVTAQKRAQSVQEIPMAVSAFDGDSLKAMGAVDTSSIVARTPGLGGGKDSDTQNVLTMRGVGTSAFAPGTDNSVGTYFNEVSLSRTIGSQGFLDIERVEVVKGPQGTLFGRNTSSGAISVTNKAADLQEDTLDLGLGFGNEGQESYEVTANKALSDTFAVRFAGKHDERDGTFQDQNGNEYHGRDHDQWRVSAHWTPSDDIDVKWFYEAFEMNSYYAPMLDAQAFQSKVTVVPSADGVTDEQEIENAFSVLNVTWDLNDNYTLTSNTGYLDSENHLSLADIAADLGGAGLNLREDWDIEQFSQDFRINSSTDSVDWFVGVSYFKEDVSLGAFVDLGPLIPAPTVPDFGIATNETNSYAVFGDLTWAVTDKLSVTVGARYTIDQKDATVDNTAGILLNAPTATKLEADEQWESFDPRVAVDYALTDDILLYANYAQGFKSGGYNKGPDLSGNVILDVDPEQNDAWEVGMKADILDGRARVNAAVFFYDYSDFQTESQNGGVLTIFNVDSMESQGLELDMTFLVTESLDLRVAYAYLDAEFKKGTADFGGGPVDLSGNDSIRSPENTYSIAATHSLNLSAGEVRTRLEYTYTDEQFYDVTNSASMKSDDYGLLNASIGFNSADGMWGVTLIGENLNDKEYDATRLQLLAEGTAIAGMGRLVRVEGRLSF